MRHPDVAQTAFERALPLRSPKAWLYKVARNEAIARREAIRREVPADVIPEQPDQMSVAVAAEWRAEQRQVRACLQEGVRVATGEFGRIFTDQR